MIRTETREDEEALRDALLMLEQIARRSSDKSSRALAQGAAAELRARVDPALLEN